MKKLLLLCLLFAFSIPAKAQFDPQAADQEFRSINRKGMWVLAGWSVSQCAVSAAALNNANGENLAFHQMNLAWNGVNTLIAGGALWLSSKTPEDLSAMSVFERHRRIKQILLFNAGLDVAYVLGGLYLRESALSRPDQMDLRNGYGNAVIMNGAFLLVFDLAMYFFQKDFGGRAIDPHLSFTPNGISLRLDF